jgi:hypothetical protein
LPRNETQALGRGNQLALSVQSATVDLVLNGIDQGTSSSPFDGYAASNFKGGYLTNGNATINFLCPDLSGGSSTPTASPTPAASSSPAVSASGSPSLAPSGSPSYSSSP